MYVMVLMGGIRELNCFSNVVAMLFSVLCMLLGMLYGEVVGALWCE